MHIESSFPEDEVIRRIGTPVMLALSAVRKDIGDLSFGINLQMSERRVLNRLSP